MSNNIIQHTTGTAILNGGDPLPGCPDNWAQAEQIEQKLNAGKEKFAQPWWSFDCGFKLDFDGPLVKVSSRFYPPKSHYGPTWDGKVSIFIAGEKIKEKKFDSPTLAELQQRVESYLQEVKEKLRTALL